MTDLLIDLFWWSGRHGLVLLAVSVGLLGMSRRAFAQLRSVTA